jgi:hypothetical protein
MSKIKVNSIEASTGSTITIPSGQTLDISATTLTLPSTVVTTTGTQTLTNKTIGVSQLSGTIPTTIGGTGLTTIGTASQVLRVNSGATALEFAALSSGKIGAVSAGYLKTTFAISSATTYMDIGLSATITPTASGSSILALISVSSGSADGTSAGHHYALYRNVNAGGDTKIDFFTGDAAGSRNRGIFAGSSESGSSWTQESSASSVLDNSTAGLSYTLGNSIVYKVYGFNSGTSAVVNRSNRDDSGTDDTRTISSLILIEVLA